MPFDLARHDMLMEREPLSPTRIRSIVDELFLPLIGLYESAPAAVDGGPAGTRLA